MMTEENQGHYPDDRYIHMPTGNLWMDSPLFWRDIPAGEWKKAFEVLRDLMPLADHTTVALTIAVGDAIDRAREEGRRAQEREATPEGDKDRFGLSPGEADRLRTLLRRSDSLNTAIATVEENPMPNTRIQEDTLEALRNLSEEARMEVDRLKREYGFPERSRPE